MFNTFSNFVSIHLNYQILYWIICWKYKDIYISNLSLKYQSLFLSTSININIWFIFTCFVLFLRLYWCFWPFSLIFLCFAKYFLDKEFKIFSMSVQLASLDFSDWLVLCWSIYILNCFFVGWKAKKVGIKLKEGEFVGDLYKWETWPLSVNK